MKSVTSNLAAYGSHRIRIINRLFLRFRPELSARKPLKNLTIEYQINQTFCRSGIYIRPLKLQK
jgi:hypothetical protein